MAPNTHSHRHPWGKHHDPFHFHIHYFLQYWIPCFHALASVTPITPGTHQSLQARTQPLLQVFFLHLHQFTFYMYLCPKVLAEASMFPSTILGQICLVCICTQADYRHHQAVRLTVSTFSCLLPLFH